MVRSYGALIALILASAQVAFAGPANPVVVVTTPPLKPYTDSLLTGIGESQSLLRAGQNAHDFSLSPSQRRLLARADLIIAPDRTMNPTLDRLLAVEEKRGAKVLSLTALKQADVLPYPQHNAWLELAGDTHEQEDHDHTRQDPHVWLDPERMAALALPVAEQIADMAPTHRARLRANAEDIGFHLREEVIPGIRTMLAKAKPYGGMSARPQVPFITYHAAYQYFLKRFGLEGHGEITQRPEAYLGAASLHGTLASAGKLSIRCIISETENPLVQRIAKASGARIVPLSPEAIYTVRDIPPTPWARNDYDRLLVKTALGFAGCL